MIEKAYLALRESMKSAKEHLKPAHPLRLLTTFEFSTFYDTDANRTNEGQIIVKRAYDRGCLGLPDLDWRLHKYALKILISMNEYIDKFTKIQ